MSLDLPTSLLMVQVYLSLFLPFLRIAPNFNYSASLNIEKYINITLIESEIRTKKYLENFSSSKVNNNTNLMRNNYKLRI